MTGVAFVCVGNAGRSQLATAFAEQERDRRGLDIDIVTGGINPTDHVHDAVVTVMNQAGIDIHDRDPRAITRSDIGNVDYVATMGCSIDEVRPDGWTGETQQWTLDHPRGEDMDAVREQRDEIKRRVSVFFNELEPSREHRTGK